MKSKIPPIARRVQLAIDRTNSLRAAVANLYAMVEHYYDRTDKAKENSSLGFSRTNYETDQSRVALWFMRDLLNWLKFMYGRQTCTFWSLAIFHGVFETLKEWELLGRMPISHVEAKMQRIRRVVNWEVVSEFKGVEGLLKEKLIQEILAQKPKKWTVPESFRYFYYGQPLSCGQKDWRISFGNNWAYRWLYDAPDDEWRI